MLKNLFCSSFLRRNWWISKFYSQWSLKNTRFTISFPVLILPVFRQLLLRTEKFPVYLCFETSMQTANDNSKEAPLVTSVLYIFKLVLYFNSSIISNQIKHYLAIKGRNFLQIHMAFTGIFADSLSAIMACYWKSMYQELKEVNV